MSEELEECSKDEEMDISIIQLKGVGVATVKKLDLFGINNLYDFCIRGAKEICEITGAPIDTCTEWVLSSKKILEDKDMIRKGNMDVVDLMDYQENESRIKLNVTDLDELFGGGLKPESLYEIYGEFGSGKTQFCLTVCANVIANGGHVIWFDCEDTFKPRRLLEILQSRGLVVNKEEGRELLRNVIYRYTPNTEEYEREEGNITSLMTKQKADLIIVDGIIGQYAEEYIGRGTLSGRQNKLRRVMTHLKNLCYYFKCTVLFTNQVQADPSVMFGDPIRPIGGNVVGHASTYRIYLKKSGKKRIARMVDSPEHAQLDVEYILNAKGIDNVED